MPLIPCECNFFSFQIQSIFVIHKKKKYRDVLKHPCHVDNVSRVRRNLFFHGLQKRFKRFYADIAWKKIQRMLCRFCLQKVCAKFKGFYSQGLNPFWVRTVWYLIDLYTWYHTVRTQNGLSPCGFMQILLAERFKGFCADIVNHRKQSPLQIADRVMTSEYVRWSIKVSTINLVLFWVVKTEDLYLKASILYSVVQAL